MADIKEIERAIETLTKADTRVVKIHHFCGAEIPYIEDNLKEPKHLAIQALTEMAEREKGCDVCNNAYKTRLGKLIFSMLEIEAKPIYYDGITIIPKNGWIQVTVGTLSFCPICGRDLRQNESNTDKYISDINSHGSEES